MLMRCVSPLFGRHLVPELAQNAPHWGNDKVTPPYCRKMTPILPFGYIPIAIRFGAMGLPRSRLKTS